MIFSHRQNKTESLLINAFLFKTILFLRFKVRKERIIKIQSRIEHRQLINENQKEININKDPFILARIYLLHNQYYFLTCQTLNIVVAFC